MLQELILFKSGYMGGSKPIPSIPVISAFPISYTNKSTQPSYYAIHALPCLRYERQTEKPMPLSYPPNPVSVGDDIRKKADGAKATSKGCSEAL
ncbi:hypothetical protein [Pedobacter panaciterrae]|uniref:hypothetical protein n=1 Tax=Pedobacter panaciterrae TaxID=363849 RepID=UPI00259AB6C8|nr:hypothetical protein [uncultured Pedobacter sp.]